MNWHLFFTLVIGVPICMALVLGWMHVCLLMVPRLGERISLGIMLSGVLLTVATISGLVSK